MNLRATSWGRLSWGLFILTLAACGGGDGPDNLLRPGQTAFSNMEPGSYGQYGGERNTMADGAEKGAPSAAPGAEPPAGRIGEVEEADIYRVDQNRLFYLNTYRGLIIYDLADPQNPKQLSRLPVYGYPVEMFVEGNTVYALIRDALYLTQTSGALKFERHNVSQLLAIDISDLAQPKILQTVDIIGELREGVSRKIEHTIYVVSQLHQYYWWGWAYEQSTTDQQEQAWVYSFNVANPKNLQLVDKLQVFTGGGYSTYDEGASSSDQRYFSGVTISATANALMVVENWENYGWSSEDNSCGSYYSKQEAVVSIIDISDPQGDIALYSKFQTSGNLGDQFKQTYIVDPASGKATYLGIFARREWSGQDCWGQQFIQNTLEAWDVSDGAAPVQLDSLAFGKPDETVRGSTFDPERKVAFAITAQAMDPLYALSFADPSDLKVLSEVDGLSGDMNVFRFIGDRKFLIGIGQDNSDTCTGFGAPSTGWSTNIAVSIIDVQDLNQIRLVQRQCVAVQNADWVGSELNWNLDQGHKMIGMHSDGQVNAITVPVYYHKRVEGNAWWWYSYETAVGLMTWDLTRYDPQKSHLEQTVLQNFGTILHPKGQVRRSIVFTHQGAQPRRMVLNLSNTHLSLVDIEDLNQPQTQALVEIAPYYSELLRFGNYLVEHVRPNAYSWYEYSGGNQQESELRIRPVGSGVLDQAAPVATITLGQVEQVIKQGQNLVVFRRVSDANDQDPYWYGNWRTEVLIYSLANPQSPQLLSSLEVPVALMPHSWYWCGSDGFWGGYWFDDYRQSGWVALANGLVFLSANYLPSGLTEHKLLALDLSAPASPLLRQLNLPGGEDVHYLDLVPDSAQPESFYLAYREKVGEALVQGDTFHRYVYFAEPWTLAAGGLQAGARINVPGRLMKTWRQGGQQRFLTYDYAFSKLSGDGYDYWQHRFRLNLLQQVTLGGAQLAQLLDSHNFQELYLKDVVLEGAKLYVNARQDVYRYDYSPASSVSWEDLSDKLQIFDLSGGKLKAAYAGTLGTYSMQLMGTYQGRLFINLPGDGVLAVDTSDPAAPVGQQFLRTLGYTTHIEFAGSSAYLSSGYFGIYQLALDDEPAIPEE